MGFQTHPLFEGWPREMMADMLRVMFWLLFVPLALWVMVAVSVAVRVYVIASEPGVAIYFQGVVCFALPVSLCGLPVLAIVAGRNAGELRRWERTAGWLFGVGSLLFLVLQLVILIQTRPRL